MFPVLALVLFLLAAAGIDNFGPLGVVELGLAAVALSLMVGNWPVNFNRGG